MEEHIFEMKLLKGSELDVHGLKIKPHTLEELVDEVGLKEYYRCIGFVSIQKKDLNEFLKLSGEEYKKTSVFQMFLMYEQLATFVIDFLKFVTRTDEVYYASMWKSITVEYEDSRVIINHKNIDDIILTILKIYCISLPKEEKEEFNPANEQARKLMERIRKNRAKAPKQKSNVDLTSIISAVAWKSNSLTIESVWKLTLYQLYDAFYRLEIIDNYDKKLSAIYAGTIDGKTEKLDKQLWYKRST